MDDFVEVLTSPSLGSSKSAGGQFLPHFAAELVTAQSIVER